MEPKMSLGRYAFLYGITTGFILALISLLSHVPGLGMAVGLVRFIALILLTMYFVRNYRDRYNDGLLSSSQGFTLTFLLFLYVGLVAAIYTGVELFISIEGDGARMHGVLREAYDNAGLEVSDQMINRVVRLVPYMVAAFLIIGHLILGAICGAIYGSSLKRENPSRDKATF